MRGCEPSPTRQALQPCPILTARPVYPTRSGRGWAGVLRSTRSPTHVSPPPTLGCALDDPRKVQELDIGSFILGWGREEGQGRSPRRKGLPDPRTLQRPALQGLWETPGSASGARPSPCDRSSPAQTLSRELRSHWGGALEALRSHHTLP